VSVRTSSPSLIGVSLYPIKTSWRNISLIPTMQFGVKFQASLCPSLSSLSVEFGVLDTLKVALLVPFLQGD
jgi:hypothetical protein